MITPLPAFSNNRKATMKRESRAHGSDSDATNSGEEINMREERKVEGRKILKTVKDG